MCAALASTYARESADELDFFLAYTGDRSHLGSEAHSRVPPVLVAGGGRPLA